MTHPFRFGVVTAFARSGDEWADKARRVESLGYSTLVMPDNLQYTLEPFPALAVAAAATRTLRVGTYVLANDYRNPVLLAKEAATLDLLSGGRLELGLGAGRPDAAGDNRMLGLPFDRGGVRVSRLGESLALIKRLLSGETATASGPHYAASEAQVTPPPVQKPHPPILVAGIGPRLLSLAAREADIVAFSWAPTETEEGAAGKVGLVREAAGSGFDRLELNLNLMAVADRVPRFISGQMGLDAARLAAAGSVAAVTGGTDEMCETLLRRRERLGISYLLVADELMDPLAPVVERLTGR
ncbi:MAG: TIGR03621 family F420-dependent LLM class oxidoreductase [Candidatus Dormibacteraeota bacterium]|nr:TIGR03621 family F420-dependent LLM class oxidoreductase [Candidatus Dormibacteraeota bacterium]